MGVIKDGYKIPFKELPDPVELRNNKSARDNAQFVSEEIQKLLVKRCVTEVKEKPTVINPLTVATNKSGKQRLVLDCRHLNKCLAKFKIGYNIDVLRQTACLVVNPIKVNNFAYLFNCTTVGRASD